MSSKVRIAQRVVLDSGGRFFFSRLSLLVLFCFSRAASELTSCQHLWQVGGAPVKLSKPKKDQRLEADSRRSRRTLLSRRCFSSLRHKQRSSGAGKLT